MNDIYTVGIIGGGVSGVVTALQLAKMGVKSILFEQKESVVNGPPFCHLHAGGNLYPDITDEQCRILMKQSIEMARLFPQSIDERPTFISIPESERYQVDDIEKRLDMLVEYYRELIEEDSANAILGSPEDYYKIYSQERLEALANEPTSERPTSADEWMTNAVKLVDYKNLKTPVILVQEYGWNLFRLGAQAQLALNETENCTLKLNNKVDKIIDVSGQNLGYNWEIYANDTLYKVNYLVNSCGFRTGEFDKCLQLNVNRLIEFKAAYVAKWEPIEGLIPELIFHGERATPHGMAQLTPYCDDLYQIHGMTEEITLFKNGLVKTNDKDKAQPEFDDKIQKKLEHGWDESEIKARTENSIDYIAKFVPSFGSATVGGPPLFGAQQIPGDDVNRRVGEVSFPSKFYARSEIIKASSALTVANEIIDKIEEENITTILKKSIKNSLLDSVSKKDIDKLASELAIKRGYPKALSRLVIEKE